MVILMPNDNKGEHTLSWSKKEKQAGHGIIVHLRSQIKVEIHVSCWRIVSPCKFTYVGFHNDRTGTIGLAYSHFHLILVIHNISG